MCLHLYSCLRTANFGTSPDCYICAEKDHSVYSAENGLETQRTGKNSIKRSVEIFLERVNMV